MNILKTSKENKMKNIFERAPSHGIVRGKGPCNGCGIRAWQWRRCESGSMLLVCVGCDHSTDNRYAERMVSDTEARLYAEIDRVKKDIDDNNAKPHRLEKAVRHAREELYRILDILYRIAGIPARGLSTSPVSIELCDRPSSEEACEQWPSRLQSSGCSAEQLEEARRYQNDLIESD